MKKIINCKNCEKWKNENYLLFEDNLKILKENRLLKEAYDKAYKKGYRHGIMDFTKK